MNLDRTTVIAGVPAKTVRDAIREMNRHDTNGCGWAVADLAAHMKISATHAEWLCETLEGQSVLERKPQPDARWHKPGMYYAVSQSGTRFINATMLKRIDRTRVDKLIAELLRRVGEINANNDLCHFVNEIRLFGSALNSKAKDFGDIDICYVLARRKLPPDRKSWSDWNFARAALSGQRNSLFIDRLTYGHTEVMRILKHRSPYLSLHDLNDVVGIGAKSIRLYIAPEGALKVYGGGTSGEAFSQAAMKTAMREAKEKAKRKHKHKRDKEPLGQAPPAALDERPKERMISAVRSLAFDILRAIDEAMPTEVLEHSIQVANERIKDYRAANEIERVADILRDILSIDLIEQRKSGENETFVFSGDRERWAQDGTNDRLAAEKGMKHAVIAELKDAITGRRDPDRRHGMTRHFETYRRAEYDEWKYRQKHGYDWYGPEHLSDRAVVTIRRIASNSDQKLDKQALKTLSDREFIKPFRKTKWRLTGKGEVAIKYHEERDAWNKRRREEPVGEADMRDRT